MIVTFYSYKGGVGRTQLAANLAAYLLYHHNRNILLIDWDIEAPGIDVFFELDRKRINKGLLDLFSEFVKKVRGEGKLEQEDLPKISKEHIVPLKSFNSSKIDLIPASKYDQDYSHKINYFDWHDFYEVCEGKYYIEYLKECLRDPKDNNLEIDRYDYIFIDSRTGVSDYSGICNIQFPDVNIIVTAPTYQNFNGCLKVLQNIIESPYVRDGHRSPIIMPILSRIIEGDNTESGIWTRKFRERFYDHLENFILLSIKEDRLDPELMRDVIDEYIENTCLPHKNELVYGENLVFDEKVENLEIGQIQVQFREIARFIEDLSGIRRNVRSKQIHSGTGDNIAGDKVILETSKRVPKYLTTIPTIDHIVGREEEVTNLKETLNSGTRMIVICGMGGVGKTSLAQYFLTQFESEFDHLVWIEQLEDLEVDIAGDLMLAKNLGLELSGDFHTDTLSILSALNSLFGQNLLVIDNADEKILALKDYLPANWKIIITSRLDLPGFQMFDLDFLSLKGAIQLFYTYYTREKDDSIVQKIIELIDYHTLTIELIAKTAHNRRIKLSELLRSLQERGLLVKEKANVQTAHSSFKKIERILPYLEATFELSDLNNREIWLLGQWIALPPIFISFDLLKELLQIEKLSGSEQEDFIFLPDRLKEKGWLIFKETDSYKMHRIVQQALTRQLQPQKESFEGIINSISQKLVIDESKDNPVDKFQWIPFGEHLLSYLDFDGNQANIEFLNNLAIVYYRLGEYSKAKDVLQRASASAERNFGMNHPASGVSFSNLALVYQSLGEYTKALDHCQKALRVTEKNYGKTDPAVATLQSNLANIYMDLGEYQKAKGLLEDSLANGIKNFGKDHPAIAARKSKLANLHSKLGEYKRAREILQEVLEIQLKIFGREHPDTANSKSDLGIIYSELGQYQKAREILQEVLEVQLKNFGHEHPDVANSKSELGMLYSRLGQYEKASEILKEALEIQLKIFGNEHIEVANTKSELGMIYLVSEQYERAQKTLLEALEIRTKALGASHPDVAIAKDMLAQVQYNLGQYKKALESYMESLSIFESQLNPNHPYLARSYNNIAAVCIEIKQYEQAMEFIMKALDIQESALDASHPSLAQSYNNMGYIYIQIRRYEEALQYLQKALKIRETILEENHPHLANTYQNIGTIYSNLKKYDIAVKFLHRAIKIRESLPSANKKKLTLAYETIAVAYEGLGELEKAKTFKHKVNQMEDDAHEEPPHLN